MRPIIEDPAPVPQKPHGAEAQCVVCEVIFSSVTGFNAHQKWRGKGDDARLTCLSAASLGYEARDRRGGVTVWVRPYDGPEMRPAANEATQDASPGPA